MLVLDKKSDIQAKRGIVGRYAMESSNRGSKLNIYSSVYL